MQVLNRQDMTDTERPASDRAQAQKLLDGTFLVPTKTCRKCGKPALVKERNLELNEGRGFMGTAVDVQVAMCFDSNCGHVAARDSDGLSGHKWLCGRANVELVAGHPYIEKLLPQPITPKQRQRIEAFLFEIA